MNDTDPRPRKTQREKDAIRVRYAGTGSIAVIPARPKSQLLEDIREKRVAIYARVSTGDPRQTSSYELQKNHYQDLIAKHPGWTLAGLYADEGISGTSLQHRDAFTRMLEDCRAHKIDLILTKSVSRFARNVLDCIGVVRELAALDPPVGVLFESESIYSLDKNSEMSLTVIASVVQEESHNKSEVMNASIDMRFRRGIFLMPPPLGYDRDGKGSLAVNEGEAQTVRLIFYLYLSGLSCAHIAETLTQLVRPTRKGRRAWSAGSVLGVLQNERYCGDVLARKTWTPNYLDHRAKKNRQDRNQYYQRGHHVPIVSREEFVAVQRMIQNTKYGCRGFLPELRAVTQGALRGFVRIHPRWAGFRAGDYLSAASDASEGGALPAEVQVAVQRGEFDFRGYQTSRGQFFHNTRKLRLRLSYREMTFSAACVRKFPDAFHAQMFLHPYRRLLAVRPVPEESRQSLQWARQADGILYGRRIGGRAFLPALFAMMGWNPAYTYRAEGVQRFAQEDCVLLFDLSDIEVFLPDASHAVPGKRPAAYPIRWAEGFGLDSYCHREADRQSFLSFQQHQALIREESVFQNGGSIDQEELQRKIAGLLEALGQELLDGI